MAGRRVIYDILEWFRATLSGDDDWIDRRSSRPDLRRHAGAVSESGFEGAARLDSAGVPPLQPLRGLPRSIVEDDSFWSSSDLRGGFEADAFGADGLGEIDGDAIVLDESSEAELLEFLASDLDPVPVDPVFRERLRDQLWSMVQSDAVKRSGQG